MGWRPSWPTPDGALIDAAAAAMEALEALAKPLAALARRLEAILEDAPDWLDSQARARVDGAISGLAWRRDTLGGVDCLARADRRRGRSRFRRLAGDRTGRGARI